MSFSNTTRASPTYKLQNSFILFFNLNICAVNLLLFSIITNTYTINTITVYITTVSLCNIHCYILIIKPTSYTNFLKFIFGIKLYMFRAVPLSIIKSFSLYIQQWYMSYRLADIYHCCMYSEKLLMMDRGTARNM